MIKPMCEFSFTDKQKTNGTALPVTLLQGSVFWLLYLVG